MKTARFLLACLAISALAACGSDPVAPVTPTAPSLEESIPPETGVPAGDTDSSVRCIDLTCTVVDLTKQAGSGG